jgi:hypothetical protein
MWILRVRKYSFGWGQRMRVVFNHLFERCRAIGLVAGTRCDQFHRQISHQRWRWLPDLLPDLRESSWATITCVCVPCGDAFRGQYPLSVSYILMSSRIATISKSVLIAPSDPSLRLFLRSTRARSLQRSSSKSSSKPKVIATSGFSSEEKPSGVGSAITRIGERGGLHSCAV